MECLVCHYKEIPKGTIKCPKCGADLEAFQTIEKIKKCQKKGNIFLVILGFLSVIFLIACLIIYFSFREKIKDSDTKIVKAKIEINKLTTQVDQKNSEISILTEKISKQEVKIIEKKEAPKNKIHIVEENETLSLIALKYFGSQDMYPKLACDNDLIDPDFVWIGQKIYIYY